jgi:ATP-binding cassette, subfamily B (MDR/TAP), member 1
LSDGPQKIFGLAGVTLGACVLFTFRHSHLYTLTLMFRIVQAFATLGIGIVIGLIYIWKVGLVGFGIFLPIHYEGVYI